MLRKKSNDMAHNKLRTFHTFAGAGWRDCTWMTSASETHSAEGAEGIAMTETCDCGAEVAEDEMTQCDECGCDICQHCEYRIGGRELCGLCSEEAEFKKTCHDEAARFE